MTICILGRQPELGLAELESLYGASATRPVGEYCALIDGDITFSHLGGTVKAATLLDGNASDPRSALKKIAKLLPSFAASLPEGKIKLGLSFYGYSFTPYHINGESLRLKKILRAAGRSVRVVPNEGNTLSSAQTYHNQLTGELGLEFVIVKDGEKTLIGRVTHVQNIDAYRIRDRERPKRDAFVGMLPPKLAQIILNLAIGTHDEKLSVLDPFCGTGVILQEALLMGYNAAGTDVSPKMIDFSRANLEWLKQKHDIHGKTYELTLADATEASWNISGPLCVASESYLGQPLGGQSPTTEKLASVMHDAGTIVRGFFKNIAPQLPAGSRLCIAVPAWFVNNTLHQLDSSYLDELGLISVEFQHAPAPLIYRREDQVVARELLVLTKAS